MIRLYNLADELPRKYDIEDSRHNMFDDRVATSN